MLKNATTTMDRFNPSLNSSGGRLLTHNNSTLYSTTSRMGRKLTLTSRTKLSSLLKTNKREEIVSQLGENAEINEIIIEKKSRQQVMFGLTLMLMSGVLYSGLATLVRWASDLGYSAAEILVYRASVQMVVAGTTYCFKSRKMKQSNIHLQSQHIKNSLKLILGRKQILAIIGRGLFGSGSTFTYFEGTTLIPVGDCVSLKALAAVFTSFAGWIILGDKITVKHGIALCLSMMAVILITQPPMIFAAIDSNIHSNFKQNYTGYLVSTASSCFQCGVYICIKLAGNVPVVMLIFSQGMFSCLLGILVLMFWEKDLHFFGNIWQEYVCIICICGIGYVSQWTLTRGGQLLIAGLASLMRATDIAWSFLWGLLFFKQIPNYLTIIGAMTMFSSVLMVSLEKIKKAAQQNKKDIDLVQDEQDKEYTVHTTDVWSITIEGKKNKKLSKDFDLKGGSEFTFGTANSFNSPIRDTKEKLKIKFVPLAEEDEKFDESFNSELTPSPKSQKLSTV